VYTLGVVGPSARATATEIAATLSGRIALVGTGEVALPGNVATTTTLGDGWQATSDGDCTLDETLDRLACSHDYALVLDMPAADIPHLVLDDTAVSTPLFETEPDSVPPVHPDRVVDALHECPEYESLGSLIASVKGSQDGDRAGAIATFTGRVRRFDSPDDVATTHLDFEMYDEVAETRMASIETDLEARDGVFDVRLHHRQGVIEAGEDIVFVVVLAGHREEAFRTVEDGINRLKDEVPIFKKETTAEEEFWLHERD